MKCILIGTLFLILLSCCSFQKNESRHITTGIFDSNLFLIKKIETMNDSIFIIYAIKKDTTYKIVSFKGNFSPCPHRKKIEIGKSYDLKLKSLLTPEGPPEAITPINLGIMLQHVEAAIFHGNAIWLEKSLSIYDIYTALNLDGLCFRE